jgi:hypothetical protein
MCVTCRVLQSRRAKARLSKFRTQLQVEISRLGGLIIRAKKSVKAFEVQSKREEAQLVRVGMRKHLGLHRYYSSLKVKQDSVMLGCRCLA